MRLVALIQDAPAEVPHRKKVGLVVLLAVLGSQWDLRLVSIRKYSTCGFLETMFMHLVHLPMVLFSLTRLLQHLLRLGQLSREIR